MTGTTYRDLQAEAKRLGISSHGVKMPELEQLIAADLAKGEQRPVRRRNLRPRRTFDPGDRVEIARVNGKGAWWCPVCDHSNHSLMRECGGCGAVRDGDEVISK